MMKKHDTFIENRFILLSSLLMLGLALGFTLAGVARLHIFVYAAAPFYFLFCVLLSTAHAQRRLRKARVKKSNANNWF